MVIKIVLLKNNIFSIEGIIAEKIDYNGKIVKEKKFNEKIFSKKNEFFFKYDRFNEYELNMLFIEYVDGVGLFGKREIKYSENFFKTYYKIGLKNLNNEVLVDFKYDHYEIDKERNIVYFYEFVFISRNKNNNLLIFHRDDENYIKKFKEYPYIVTKYNYLTNSFISSFEYIKKDTNLSDYDYMFLSRNNDRVNLLIAIYENHDSNRYKYINLKEMTYAELYSLTLKFRKGISAIKYLDNWEENNRLDSLSKNNSNCFIATLAYKDINHPKVELFRNFRDNHLINYSLGMLFVKYYYKYSPNIVLFLKPYKNVNKFIRFVLDILLKILPINKNE